MIDSFGILALTQAELTKGLGLYLMLVASLSIHEWAHAFTADRLGDGLPRAQGRVTLNPIAHIDPIGTVVLPLIMILLNPGFAIFGWGKPVQLSLPNRKTRVRDDLLVTGAGPLSNLLLAFCIACIGKLLFAFIATSPEMVTFFITFITINCLLFLFNMIPVPPLDGSHFLKHAIGMSEQTYFAFARYGFLIILVLINLKAPMLFFGHYVKKLASFFVQFMA